MANYSATITLGEGVTGLAFSISQLRQIFSNPQLQAALPYWGLIQGTLKTVQFLDTTFIVLAKETNKVNKWDYLEELAHGLANGNLIYQSACTLTTGAGKFVPWGFALASAVEFVSAVRRTYELREYLNRPSLIGNKNNNKRELYEAYADVVSKLLTAVAWAAIAVGNPVGWMLMAIVSLQRIYSAVSTYHQLGIFGQQAHSPDARKPVQTWEFRSSGAGMTI